MGSDKFGATFYTGVTAQAKAGGGVSAQLVHFDLFTAADTVAIEPGIDALKRRINRGDIIFELTYQYLTILWHQIRAARLSRQDGAQVAFQLAAELFE